MYQNISIYQYIQEAPQFGPLDYYAITLCQGAMND